MKLNGDRMLSPSMIRDLKYTTHLPTVELAFHLGQKLRKLSILFLLLNFSLSKYSFL
jgi:hypothetical protein